MNARLILHLALSETRRSRGRLLFCVLSIAMGVFALTAVRSISSSVNATFAGQARQTLGADLVVSANQPLDELVGEASAALEASGARSTTKVRFYSMLARVDDTTGTDRQAPDDLAPGSSKPGSSKPGSSKLTRSNPAKQSGLARVHAVGSDFPLYGAIHTQPEGVFEQLGERPIVVADRRIIQQLGLRVGDTVRLGQWHATLGAELVNDAGSPTAEFSMAPAVYLHTRFLPETHLVQTGSRIEYERLFALPAGADAAQAKGALEARVDSDRVRVRTAKQAASNVRRFLGRTSRFMTVAGLVTLLLGALGIASALRAFMLDKLDHAAILRCLGITPKGVFWIYTILAALVAFVGCSLGALLGMGLPVVVSPVLRDMGQGFLPADMAWSPSVVSALHGVLAGMVATLAFTVVPVLRTANVAPLRVLRRDVEHASGGGRPHWILALGILSAFGATLLLSIVESDSRDVGIAFTGAVAVALMVLWALAQVLVRMARAVGASVPGYAVRQGIANLHRPGNQTVSVVLAVGLGVMLLSTLLIIEHSLQQAVSIEQRGEVPNLFVIDVQPEQVDPVRETVAAASGVDFELSPMVAARIRAVNGDTGAADNASDADRTAMAGDDSDLADGSARRRARQREYFLSYRSQVLDSEEVSAGQFWSGRPASQEASLDEQLASTLDIKLGDTLTLDIQGLPLRAKVTSLRQIHWESIRPNSMIVLSPGEIEQAPRTYVGAFRMADEAQRYALSDRLSKQFPNLSIIDVTDAAKTVKHIIAQVSLVFRALGALALATGGLILAGAVASGRHARQREAMLLKVLGAKRQVLRTILTTEYLTLAALGAVAGLALSEAFNRLVLGTLFGVPIVVPYAAVFALLAATIAVNVALAFAVGRTVSQAQPLELLREDR